MEMILTIRERRRAIKERAVKQRKVSVSRELKLLRSMSVEDLLELQRILTNG